MRTFLLDSGAVLCGSLELAASGEDRSEVKVAKSSIVLPTYAPGGYDKTPLFYTGRVYQGAQGRVYPYPMQDVLFDGTTRRTRT